MNLYQSELARKVIKYGCNCDYNTEQKRLVISYGGKAFVEQGENGFLYYKQKDISMPDIKDMFLKIMNDAEDIREYVSIYEASPQMPFKDIQQYKMFGRYNDVVFGGTYNNSIGFLFSSWSVCNDGKSVVHGEYSPDYRYSKEYFALRSGLVDKHKIFESEESEEIYKAIKFAKENCETLTYGQERTLEDILYKLEEAYPSIMDSPPESPTQLNM